MTGRSRGTAGLLAQIHRAPRDLALRAVYADALLEQGDPRGELIALQLERSRTGKRPTARERELVKQHWDRWLGPLVPVLDRRYSGFENGFLHTARLNYYRDPMTAAELDHPAWRTVEALDTVAVTDNPPHHHEPAALVARIPALRVLECDVDDCLSRIRREVKAHPLEAFGAYLKHERQLRELLRVLDTGLFPELVDVRTRPRQAPLADLRELVARVPKLRTLTCFLHPGERETVRAIEELVDRVPAFGMRFRFGEARIARAGDRLAFEIVEMRYLDDLRPLLDALGPGRVVVSGKLAARHGAELVAAGFAVAGRAAGASAKPAKRATPASAKPARVMRAKPARRDAARRAASRRTRSGR